MTSQTMTERPRPGEEGGTSRRAPPAGHSGTEAFPIRGESEVSTSGPFSPKGQPGLLWEVPWEAQLVLSTDSLGLRRGAESRERNMSTLTALCS